MGDTLTPNRAARIRLWGIRESGLRNSAMPAALLTAWQTSDPTDYGFLV
jgi:hypothetical protein